MIALFILEAFFYYSENGNLNWIAYLIVIALSVLYLIGAYLNEKSVKNQ